MPGPHLGVVNFDRRALAVALFALVSSAAVAQVARPSPRPHPRVARVPVAPPPLAGHDTPGSSGDRRACVEADRIMGATVLGDRTIELLLDDGERLHMSFAADCPFLGFYQGFYYRRTQAGKLCAGHDSIIDRSGGACFIEQIRRHRAPKP